MGGDSLRRDRDRDLPGRARRHPRARLVYPLGAARPTATVLTICVLATVWIGVGGLLLDVARTNDQRLVYEVGPGIGLVGLLCTLIAYHGRHHPAE